MIKFDTTDKKLCRSIGIALIAYAEGKDLLAPTAVEAAPVKPEVKPEVKPAPVKPEVKPDTAKAFSDKEAEPEEAEPEVVEPTPLPPPAAEKTKGAFDDKGVTFNDEFCGHAAEPFYTSGPRQGQWKKKRGLDQKAYDSWYAGELLAKKPAVDAVKEKTEAQVTAAATKAAFSGNPSDPVVPVPETDDDIPSNAGELMGWVAEMQTAGRIDQNGIEDAYEKSGYTPGDLFSGKEGAVQGIYEALRDGLV